MFIYIGASCTHLAFGPSTCRCRSTAGKGKRKGEGWGGSTLLEREKGKGAMGRVSRVPVPGLPPASLAPYIYIHVYMYIYRYVCMYR